jgi:hypothetical protein
MDLNEEIYTCAELALMYRLRVATIFKLFVDEPGVLRLRNARGASRYEVLRIPRHIVQRVFDRFTVGAEGGDATAA